MEAFMVGLTWLGLFSAAFLAWYFYLQARTKERTLLIEKGADASSFYGKSKEKEKKSFRFPWMKFGLLISGLGLGLGLGLLIVSIPTLKYDLKNVAPGIIFALMLFFGGVGMIAAHFVDGKKQNLAL
nr:DUF6249 domain-containing protein [uncultured Carboxylicivirga sp.]